MQAADARRGDTRRTAAEGARVAVAKGAGFIRIVFIVVVSAFALKIGWDILASR